MLSQSPLQLARSTDFALGNHISPKYRMARVQIYDAFSRAAVQVQRGSVKFDRNAAGNKNSSSHCFQRFLGTIRHALNNMGDEPLKSTERKKP